MVNILLLIFFSTSFYIAITRYGWAGIGLIATGLALGLCIATKMVENEKKKFRTRDVFTYDSKGRPKYLKEENGDNR